MYLDQLEAQLRHFAQRCFHHQNEDGGLPETFPGAASGCWTSSEVYAGVCLTGSRALCPDGAFERLETYLLAMCERHNGDGLPYYHATNDDGRTVSRPLVEATASLVMGLRVRFPVHPAVATATRWLLAAQRSDGAWGIAPQEPARVYSTCYAYMALGAEATDARTRAAAWLIEQGRDIGGEGYWSYRPGLESPSVLCTALTLQALGDVLPLTVQRSARAYLSARLTSGSVVEEDELPTRRGLKLTFTYAPRLLTIATLLSKGTGEGKHESRVVDRATRALAIWLARSRHEDRIVPEVAEERMWHFIEVVWGGGACLDTLRANDDVRRHFEDNAEAVVRLEIWHRLSEHAPPPLSHLAIRFQDAADLPTEQIAVLMSLSETLARIIRARSAGWLAAAQPEGRWRRHLEETPRGLGRAAWVLWRDLVRLPRPGNGAPAAAALAAFLREGAAARAVFERVRTFRNRAAHQLPTSAAQRRVLVDRWVAALAELVTSWPTLLDPPFLTVSEIANPAGSDAVRYLVREWRGRYRRPIEHLLETTERLPDRAELATPEAAGAPVREVRWVYTGDPELGTRGLVPLSPFVLLARCSACSEPHFFVMEEISRRSMEEAGLWRLVGDCGGFLEVFATLGSTQEN